MVTLVGVHQALDMHLLEQLRFLENDIPIATFVTEYRPRAIDVPEDLEALIAEGIDD